jgi:hypothetical protein
VAGGHFLNTAISPGIEWSGDTMNICALTAGVTALANALAGTMTTDQLTMAAALFTQLGDTLGTIAAQQAICQEQLETNSTSGKS